MAKSVSRKSAAKKAAKTRKSGAAARKAAKTGKRRTAAKKAAPTRKRRVAAKKPPAARKKKAVAATRAKTAASTGILLHEESPAIAEIDDRIAIVRTNLRALVEQAASYSGASNEELVSNRIAEQEAKLALLIKQRDELSRRGT